MTEIAVIGKLTGLVWSKVRGLVFERAAKHRQKVFVESLTETLREELFYDASEDAAEALLDKMLAKKELEEAVHDSFRRVALSRSRELGPRITGYMLGNILAESRAASVDEQRWADASENLYDDELRDFVQSFDQWTMAAEDKKPGFFLNGFGLSSQIHSDSMDDSRQGQMDTSSLLPGSKSWQRKLASLGIIYERILDQRVRYEADLERHVDEPGSTRTVTWSLVIPDNSRPFVELIKRAIAAETIRRESG